MPQIWLIFIILSIVLNALNKKKKQSAAQSAQPGERTVAQHARPAARPAAQKPPQQPKPMAQAMEAKPVAPAHVSMPLDAHIHTPVMGVEGVGTEGEDCCHEYMLEDRLAAAPEASAAVDAQTTMEAQALLQGVIFSEILGRRPIRVYGRKRA